MHTYTCMMMMMMMMMMHTFEGYACVHMYKYTHMYNTHTYIHKHIYIQYTDYGNSEVVTLQNIRIPEAGDPAAGMYAPRACARGYD
jgi:hypothetical protein